MADFSQPWAWRDAVIPVIGPVARHGAARGAEADPAPNPPDRTAKPDTDRPAAGTRVDDAGWNEGDHPRVPKGSEGGGQFTSGGGGGGASAPTRSGKQKAMENVPKPWGWLEKQKNAAAHRITDLARQGIERDESPSDIARKIKDVARSTVHPIISRLANQVLEHLEAEFELKPGSLGKASPKSKEPPPPERDKQRIIDTIPKPPDWFTRQASYSKIAGAVRDIVAKGVERDAAPEQMAEALKALGGAYRVTGVANYANALIRHIEAEFGLEKGSLGNAVAKQKEEAKPEPEPKPEPKPKREPEKKAEPRYKTIGDVIKERGKSWGQRERTWHEQAFTNATPGFLAAMAKTKYLTAIAETDRTPHYKPGRHQIAMNKWWGDRITQEGTWRHEYGHAMDWNGGYTSISAQAEQDRVEEARNLIDSVGKASLEHIPQYDFDKHAKEVGFTEDRLQSFAKGNAFRVRAVLLVLKGKAGTRDLLDASPSEQAGNYRDFIGALTRNRIGGGHSDEYYTQNPTYRTAEMFANYVALTEGPEGEVYRPLLHKIAPRCCAKFDKIIEGRAKSMTNEEIAAEWRRS